MKKTKQTDITRTVMDQIKHGDVQMRPRRYFMALTVVSIAAVALSAVSVAYLSSIVFFWLRIATADTMAWGARANFSEAVASFPWWALTLTVPLFVLTVWLVRKQGRLYRYSVRSVVLVLAAISVLVGLGLSYLDIDSHVGEYPGTRNGQGNHRQDR